MAAIRRQRPPNMFNHISFGIPSNSILLSRTVRRIEGEIRKYGAAIQIRLRKWKETERNAIQ